MQINRLMTEFQLGWNKASNLVKRLEEMGIIDRPEGKLPRKVIPISPEEIPEELVNFIEKAGYSRYSINAAFYGQ